MQMYVSELKRLVSDIPETEDSLAFLSIFREKFQVEEGFKTLDRSEECVEVNLFMVILICEVCVVAI